MLNVSESMTVSGHTCAACSRPISKGAAVLRGNGRELVAWHRECFTIHRAVKDVCAAEIAAEIAFGGTLSERLARVGLS